MKIKRSFWERKKGIIVWSLFIFVFVMGLGITAGFSHVDDITGLPLVKAYILLAIFWVLVGIYLGYLVKNDIPSYDPEDDLEPNFGKETIIDLHHCDTSLFNRDDIDRYFEGVCEIMGVERDECHFWDDVGVPEEEQQTEPHTQGTTAVQFILTSNITIHTLDQLKAVYVNAFSCSDFNAEKVVDYTQEFFDAENAEYTVLNRV